MTALSLPDSAMFLLSIILSAAFGDFSGKVEAKFYCYIPLWVTFAGQVGTVC